uniref:SFRICE_032911 n=1 Tax=Spodoptera frugiperda TaxID=7108 RepID=A0A2H1X1M4_SPOFR
MLSAYSRAIEGQSYEMIPTKKGKFLLMFQGYTYSQQNQSRNYYCSKKDVGCKARLKLDSNGKIISTAFTTHMHPAPKYVFSNGRYFKYEIDFIHTSTFNFIVILVRHTKLIIMLSAYSRNYLTKNLASCYRQTFSSHVLVLLKVKRMK